MNVVGLDIGGTKICGVLFNGKKAVKVLTIPTPKSLPSFKASIKKMVDTLSMGQKVEGIGVGMAGIVDHDKNVVVHSPNLKFVQNFSLKELFPQIKKIAVDNDANCFARGEAGLGQGKALKTFVALTLGTGIGGGLVTAGNVYVGEHGSAGEAGHMLMDGDQTFEYFYQKARDTSNYKQMGKIVGALLANIYNLLDVEVVILGGSVSIRSGDKFLPAALEFCQKRLLNYNIKPKVLVSNLENAGAIGAALLLK